jgi:CHAT domain-containing protein
MALAPRGPRDFAAPVRGFVVGKTLHDEMFCALASQLAQQRITQIVFVPDSFLAPLPLHLAWVCSKNVAEIMNAIQVVRRPSEVNFLGEAFPVEYATCLQVIACSQYQKFPRNLSRVIALSDPLSDLPSAGATAQWMAEIAGSGAWLTSWIGPDATRANLLSGLETADIVVVGTHGNFDITRPGRSRLVFADGDWTLTEMLDQRTLSRGVLAILGACEIGSSTAVGDPREVSGIPGGLLSAGASAVLAPLWPFTAAHCVAVD